MTSSVKLEQDEKKILLLKMKYILQQIEHLEQELKSVVELNQRLSSLSFTESLTVINKTDPEIIRLKQEFSRFSHKNEDRSSEDLLEIHSGVKKLLNIQLQRIMEFSEKEIPIDKALIVKTAQAIRKSSKTVLAIESLLYQRGIQEYEALNLTAANQKIEKKIDYIDSKENTLHTTIKIIEHVTPEGEQNDEYQALITHLKNGGSLDEIETKFHVEKIEIQVNQENGAEEDMSDLPPQVTNPAPEYSPHKEENPGDTAVEKQDNTPPLSAFRLFWLVFSRWLNTPSEINWKIAKQQILEKYHQQ